MARLNRARRFHFYSGMYFPPTYLPLFQPIPPSLMVYLPPPPPGYALGYYGGYAVVYDPTTRFVASVIDLFNY